MVRNIFSKKIISLFTMLLCLLLAQVILMPLANKAAAGNEYGLTRSVAFEHLGLTAGLSQSSVFAILQDSVGFMWFGTKDGLNRYDGVSFTVYKHRKDDPSSISDNHITCLFKDSRDRIWIGTQVGGLNRYNPLTDTFDIFIHNEDAHISSILSNNINGIAEDSKGNLWIGTAGGIVVFDTVANTFKQFTTANSPLVSNRVWSLCSDASGDIWIGTNSGLFFYNVAKDQFIVYRNDNNMPVDEYPLPHNVVRAVCYSQAENVIWAGTYDGITCFNIASGQFDRSRVFKYNPAVEGSLSNERVRSLTAAKDGTLWVGTPDGLCELKKGDNKFTVYKNEKGNDRSLTDSTLWTVFIDRQNIVWIGTFAGGINMLIKDKQAFGVVAHVSGNIQSLDSPYVQSVLRDSRGHLWIGTFDGLNCIDGQTGVVTTYHNDPFDDTSIVGHTIKAIEEDGYGRIWVGSTGGLDMMTADGKFMHIALTNINTSRYDGMVTSLNYKDGSIYVGTLFGLMVIDIKTLESVAYDEATFSVYPVNSVTHDSKSFMWVSTNNGLYKYNMQTAAYQHYSVAMGGLLSNRVESVYEDSKGNIWACTASGLSLYNAVSNSFNYHYWQDEIAHNVLEDAQGYIWLSTNKGLVRFDFRNGDYTKEYNMYVFDIYDGLPANEFSEDAAFLDKAGILYFGSINGLVWFKGADVQTIIENVYQPTVVITDIVLREGDRKLALEKAPWDTKELQLSYKNNSFSIYFTAFDYVQAKNITYRYILEGFDKEEHTVNTDDRLASYTNLGAGKYTLKIYAVDSSGQKYQDYKTLLITIGAPWYQAWWVIALEVLAAMSLIWAIIWMRTKAVSRQKDKLKILISERTKELHLAYNKERQLNARLAEEIDQRISFNRALVHELKTPLTPMIATSELMVHLYKDEPIRGFAGNVLDGSLALNKRIDELLDVAKSETGMLSINKRKMNLSKLGQDMYTYLLPRFGNNGVHFSYDNGGQEVFINADKERIKQVLLNLLDNAAKHTKTDDTVVLSVWQEASQAFISVKDSGEGIPKEQQAAIFETYTSAKKRLTKYDGLGIGLYLVHKIVTKHDGTIIVKSAKGAGCEFIVTLPTGSKG